MNNAPKLTDETGLRRHRARARRDIADFLHLAAKDELEDRLSVVNKTFTSPLIVSGFPEIWADFLPQAKVIEDTEFLDVPAESYDLAIHALALHWANDPVGQLIQCRRAMKPDGLFLAVLFGGQTLNELRSSLAQAEASVTGGLSPRVAPMAEIRELGGLLQRAGFTLPVADSVPFHVTYESAFDLMKDLRAMGETNALNARSRVPTKRAILKKAAEIYAANFGTSDGRISASFEMIFLAGWSPHASQPKPLRPGSAQARLSDALGVPENMLKH
jgi:SAM-dependent methyltransferase